jgi:CCR4-NOT transcription complex subunit 2
MSLFGKDFLKEGSETGKEIDSNYFSQEAYGNDGNFGGLGNGSAQGGHGFPSAYGGSAQQQSRLTGLQGGAGQPLFNRTANPQAAGKSTLPGTTAPASASSFGGILGLGGSTASSTNNTPGRAGLGPDLSRFSVAGGNSTGSQGLGGLRGLGGSTGVAGGEDDIMSSFMGNIAGMNESGEEFGSNGSSIFGSSADGSNSLLGNSRASSGSSLLGSGGLGAIGGSTGGDLLSSLTNSGGFQSNSFLSNLSMNQSQSSGPATAATSKDSKYGLLGLLNDVLRASDKDSQQLSLGADLTTFGLNLSASENLYPTFISPFTENMLDEKPYKVPACYLAPSASLKAEHITKFSVETLFYMFYLMPKDVFQSLAALELYRREWRYHGELKVWLKPRTQQEMLQAHPQVHFVYFDPKSFEARLFNATGRGNLSPGIVSEEDIRSRISPASITSVTSGNSTQQAATTSGLSSLPGMLGGNTGGLSLLGGDSS